MDRLPTEVLDRICDACDPSSLKAIWRTCRGARSAVERRMLREICLHVTQGSARRARAITRHARFGHAPAKLCVRADVPRRLSREEWRARGGVGGDAGFARHERRACRAAALVADGTLEGCLRAVLSAPGASGRRATGIRTVEFAADGASGEAATTATAEGAMARTHPRDVLGAFDEEAHRRSVAAFHALLRAADAAGFSASTLRLGAVSHTVLLGERKLRVAFARLVADTQELRWDLQVPGAFRARPPDWEACRRVVAELEGGCIAAALKHAGRLRVLALDMAIPTSVDAMVGTHLWPCLEDVTLGGVETDRAALPRFLLQHASTLRRVRLRRACLRGGGTWAACFAKIAGQLPALRSLALGGVFWEEDGYRQFHDFDRREDGYGERLAEYVQVPAGGFPAPPAVAPRTVDGAGA